VGKIDGLLIIYFFFIPQVSATRRNRRTHIALEAFSALVRKGFSAPGKTEELLAGIEALDTEALRKKCKNKGIHSQVRIPKLLFIPSS
jgi:hypothetical protein